MKLPQLDPFSAHTLEGPPDEYFLCKCPTNWTDRRVLLELGNGGRIIGLSCVDCESQVLLQDYLGEVHAENLPVLLTLHVEEGLGDEEGEDYRWYELTAAVDPLDTAGGEAP